MPIEEKISVDYSELDDAEKAAKSLETTVKSSEAAQNKAVKEGINERTQTIRDGLAAQLKETRAGSQARVKEAQEALRKEEISEKEYAKRMVAIQAEAQKQIASLKATRAQLLPQQVNQTADTSSNLGGLAIGAIGVGALAVGFKNLAQTATQAEATLQGLDSVVGYKLGKQSIPQAHEELEKITRTGLLSKSDGAAAIKNLVAMGYALDDATNIILRNTDVAVKNRQANYSVSESVRIFTEGLKNGNSTLTDATGIQTNISVMLKKHGASLDDLNDKVRAGAARQAILKEVMAETAPFIGDAERASKSYAGAISKLSAAWDETKAAGGGFIAAVLTPLINILTTVVTGIRDFVKEMDGVNAAIIGIAASSALIVGFGVSFIATAGGVQAAMVAVTAKATAMWAAITGPIGLAITLIAAAAAAIYSIYNATKPTPGQLLIQEKQQLEALVRETENAKNKTAEFEKAKKRLADINKQVTSEYGPYLQALGLEEKQLERNIGLIRQIDKTKKDVQKNTKEESAYEIQMRIDFKRQDIDNINKQAQDLIDTYTRKGGIGGAQAARQFYSNYFDEFDAQLRDEKIKLKALEDEFNQKKPKKAAATNVAQVQQPFVADLTTVQQLQDLQRFYQARAALAREGAEAEKIAEEMRSNELMLELAKRKYAVINGKKQELLSLDDLEREKNRLEQASLKATTQTQKNDLAASLKVNQQKMQMVQKRIEAEKQLEAEHVNWKKRAGQEMYEFGQALLSAEEGSFLKYLANKLRNYTAEKSAELYAEAAGAAATGNFPLAALYAAGGAAVQIAGELGARALEKEAEKKTKIQGGAPVDLGGIASPTAPDLSSVTPGTSVTNITSVVTNEYGTYIREADFIRKQVRPEIQKIAAERGKVMFK